MDLFYAILLYVSYINVRWFTDHSLGYIDINVPFYTVGVFFWSVTACFYRVHCHFEVGTHVKLSVNFFPSARPRIFEPALFPQSCPVLAQCAWLFDAF